MINIMNISKKNFVLILILLALASGFIWGIPFNDPIKDDAYSYDQAALTILEKGFFYKSDFMNFMIDRAFYPVFLAGVYKIFGHDPIIARLIQIFIFAFLAWLVYKLGQLVFDEYLARLTGILIALCYSIASFTSYIYREVFFSTLVFLLIYCLYQAQIKKKIIWFIASGVIFGMAFLTNTVIQFFLIIIIVNFLIINRKEGFRKIAFKVVVLFLAFLAFTSPWLVNNYLNYGRTPFVSKQGFLLAMKAERMHNIEPKYIQHLVGNTLGDFFAQKFFPDYNRKESRFGWNSYLEWKDLTGQGEEMTIEADKILTERAFKDIINHPILAFKMTLIDFLKFNTPMVPDVGMQHMFAEPDSYPNLSDFTKGSIILFIRFIYLIFAIFIIYAIVKHIRNWPKIGWIVLIVVYFNLAFSNLIGVARHSTPMYTFYIILFVLGLLTYWRKKDKKI